MELDKELEINGEKYVIKKLTFGQLAKLTNLANSSRLDELLITTVMFGLKSAPQMPITKDYIENLPMDVGQKLFEEISKFNQPLDDLKKTELDKFSNIALPTISGLQNSQLSSSSQKN